MTTKLALTFTFAILIVVQSGCSRNYLFDGVIVDGDGQPIAGAIIMLFPHNGDRPTQLRADGTSGDDGNFEAVWGDAVGVDYFRMVVSMAGYREHEQLVQADKKNLRIVLERISDEDETPGEPD